MSILFTRIADAAASRDGGQEFLTGGQIFAECAEHPARHHRDPVLAYAAGGHAAVRRLHDDADPARLEDLIDGVGDLCRQPLLHLEPARERVHDAGELRDADDPVTGQIADMHSSADCRHVVLAAGLERDVAQNDDVVVAANLLEGPLQDFGGVLTVASEPSA